MIKLFLILAISSAIFAATLEFQPSLKYGTKEEYDLWVLIEHCKQCGVTVEGNYLMRCKEVVNEINHSNFFKITQVSCGAEFERLLTIHKALFHNIDTRIFMIDNSVINSYYQAFTNYGKQMDYGIAVAGDGPATTMSFFKDKKSLGKILFFQL